MYSTQEPRERERDVLFSFSFAKNVFIEHSKMKNAKSQSSSLGFLMWLQILLLWNLALLHLAQSVCLCVCTFVCVFLEPSGLYKEGMTTHSSILAWRIPRLEEPHSSLLNKSHKTSWSWPRREMFLAGRGRRWFWLLQESRKESKTEKKPLNWVSRWPSEGW